MVSINSKVFYMKKLFCILIVLLFALTACSQEAASSIQDRPDDDALITLNGDTVLTVRDYNRIVIFNQVSHEYNDTELLSEEELFTTEAEYVCAAYLATLFNVQADMDDMYADYDSAVSDMTANLDNDALEYAAKLQNSLDMTDEEFRDWCANYSYIRTSAQNLIQDIADVYGNITNGDAMAEEIIANLKQMLNEYGFECSFDGYTDYIPDFSHIV